MIDVEDIPRRQRLAQARLRPVLEDRMIPLLQSPRNQMPEPVRKKKLKEFRWHLYDASLDRKGKCKPSEASDFPSTKEQELCKHPFERLAWGANGSAHWASCRACGLKKVLYYSREHGALAAETHQVNEDVHATYIINSEDIILDTGCRTAVGG